MNMFSALLGKSLSGGGGSEPVLVSKSITANGTYDPADDSADGYSSVTVNVPNSYTAADEGKVVSNGSLVAQGSDTVTQNGTVDTTLISSLLVNVSGGAGGLIQIAKLTSDSSYLTTNDIYICESSTNFYIFGCLARSSGSNAITFHIPNDFDVTNIGSFSIGCYATIYIPSADKIDMYLNKQSKTISFGVISYPSSYIGIFEKST